MKTLAASNDLAKAKAFYDALLGSASVIPLFEHPSGGRAYAKDGNLFFVVLGTYDKKPATVGNGSMHTFRFDSRAEVDAFHAKALALGGKDEGAPANARRNSTCHISGTSTVTNSVRSIWGECAAEFKMRQSRDMSDISALIVTQESPVAKCGPYKKKAA
jgi:hypothetical protein